MRLALVLALDLARLFAGRDACVEVHDVRSDKVVESYGGKRCQQRTSPCSTFKVALALMAFDAGVLVDENSAEKWDGVDRERPSWNRDQTAASWMKESVVWFSQRLTPRLGLPKIAAYLKAFDYGNQDFSGGLTTAWLGSSLQISPDEQLRFWRRWWLGQVGVSARATELTKTLTLVDTSANGWTLHGKTGSCRGVGWYAGHVGKGAEDYVFVVNYTDRAPSKDPRPPGFIAREMALRVLGALHVY